MLDRLIGLETEYATIVRSPADQEEAPSRRDVYDAICDEIAKRLPTARGLYDADAIFFHVLQERRSFKYYGLELPVLGPLRLGVS